MGRLQDPALQTALKAVAAAAVVLSLVGCGRRAPATTIVKGLSDVSAVHLDGEHVYWRGHNAVLRANKDGTDTRSMLQAELTDFYVDTSAIYFTSETAGVVATVPLAGGMEQTLANKQAKPGRITGDFVFLYVCNRDASGSVVKIAKSGGAPQILADKLSEPQAIAVDTASVFFGTSNGSVMRVAKAGGTVQKIDADTSVVTDVAVDDSDVYWVSHFGPAIKVLKAPKAGGPRTELAAFEGDGPRMALLGGFLFVSYEVGGKVEAAKVTVDKSAPPKPLGGARGNSVGIAVDAVHVFLGVADPKGEDGWIVRLPR
jgi:Domain of unknown function (DUF5050)